jgi:hypothetical protein
MIATVSGAASSWRWTILGFFPSTFSKSLARSRLASTIGTHENRKRRIEDDQLAGGALRGLRLSTCQGASPAPYNQRGKQQHFRGDLAAASAMRAFITLHADLFFLLLFQPGFSG